MKKTIEKETLLKRFDLADLGIVPAGESTTFPVYEKWLAAGCAAGMDYLVRNPEARRRPDSVLPGVRTILAVVWPERDLPPAKGAEALGAAGFFAEKSADAVADSAVDSAWGEIVPYAVRRDYHAVLREKLHAIRAFLAVEFPSERFRVTVDSAPLLEKEWAARAGLGSVGKNSLLLHRRFGSRFFLGFLLTTLPPETFGFESEGDKSEMIADPCSGCDACRRACPTGAIRSDLDRPLLRTLDASRCLNYWTLEDRGESLPEEVRVNLGGRLVGCDACRLACPKNRDAGRPLSFFLPRQAVCQMTAEEFDALFSETPVERVGLERLKRNARGKR